VRKCQAAAQKYNYLLDCVFYCLKQAGLLLSKCS
jgi:hypothetical protein